MGVKICASCRADVSDKPRVKDPAGTYYCQACYDAKKQGKAGAVVSSVFDEPIVPTADLVAPKEDPKKAKVVVEQELPPKVCSSCGVQMPATGIVCTNCGFDTTKGKALKTKIEKAKVIREKRTSSGGGITMEQVGIGIACAGTLAVVGLAVAGHLMGDRTLMGTGVLAAWGFLIVSSVVTLVNAFMKSVIDGLLVWFLPFYVLFFLIARCESLAVRVMFGGAVVSAGVALGLMVTMAES